MLLDLVWKPTGEQPALSLSPHLYMLPVMPCHPLKSIRLWHASLRFWHLNIHVYIFVLEKLSVLLTDKI